MGLRKEQGMYLYNEGTPAIRFALGARKFTANAFEGFTTRTIKS